MSTTDTQRAACGPRALIFGEVLFDCFPGGVRVPGGAPFNVAWHLQALGACPVLISAVGDDGMGRQIHQTMTRWGLSVAGLQVDPQHATGEVRVRLHEGQPSFEVLEDRAYDHIRAQWPAHMDVALLYHGTLALRQPRSEAVLDSLLDACGAPVFMDVNLRAPWWSPAMVSRRLEQATWVKINHHELEVLQGPPGDAVDRARRLLERYELEAIVVTLAEDGAFALDSNGTLARAVPAPAAEVVDTVGAGDAFAAICILGVLRKWDISTAIERAQHFASQVVGQRGATTEDATLYRSTMEAWRRTASGQAS